MDKVEYYSIREDIGIANKIGTFQQYIMDILEVYPMLKDMTLEDAKWWFFNRQCEWNQKIQDKLNVK